MRDACLAKVAIDCAELEYQHIQECQETHAPIIAAAQAAALEKLPAIQEAMYVLQTEQAIQFSLARKLNELEAIAAREYQITCFKAQYDAELAVGTEVEMAKTPNGRHAITGIITAPTPCLHDARVLPSGHLFVNAALYPGFETWRPTWRVGTVKEVIAPDLKIQFAPANLAGSLGTLYSENPLDCTPPQIYFDGVDPMTAEANIVTARNALKDAQQALLDAVKIQNDCIAEFDQAWMDQCYGTAVEICDESYSASIEPALQDRATCYADGPANCEESVAAGLEACEAAFRPAIEEKQGLVDAAQLVVTETAQELVDAQQALAAIEAEIQVCVDAINTQEWLDARMVELTAWCKNETDGGYDFCITNGGTPEDCDAVRDAQFADCVQLMADEVLLVNQADAMAQCRDDRQADLDAAANAIDAAYYPAMQAELLMGQAEDALEAAEKDLADCNKNWDLAECIASAMAVCDDTYTHATELFTLAKAACYEEAMRTCDEQRDAAIQACRDDNAPAIEAAQIVVDEAVRDVELATNGRYNPADPLILDCPVAHCRADHYELGDSVLIDFPVRSGATAMAVWASRRVIGWADNTRTCITVTWLPYILLRISCRLYAKNTQSTFTDEIVITDSHGSFYFDANCDCGAPEGGPAVIFDAEITSEYIKVDPGNDFWFETLPGIASRTGGYAYGTGSQSCDNALVFNNNTAPYISVINSSLTPCGTPCFGKITGTGHFDRTNVPLANMDSLFTIPPSVRLQHTDTSEEKNYLRHIAGMVVSEYPWDIADDDAEELALYNGTIDIVYIPEEDPAE